MRAVVQRVLWAKVTVGGEELAAIGPGLLVFLGVGKGDTRADAAYLADKIAHLRIFNDAEGKLNISARDQGAEILVVSQFTLYGDCRHGRRPSFTEAAPPAEAEPLYFAFLEHLQNLGLKVAAGRFQAEMIVELANHGPVTILFESRKLF